MTIKTRTSTKAPAKVAAKTTKATTAARKPFAEQIAKAKAGKVQDVAEVEEHSTTTTQLDATAQQGVAMENMDRPITGRGVFAVRTMGNAVSVEAAFLAEDGNVLRLPAVFPNREYALEQIEELKMLLNRHFDELQGK